MNLSPIIDFFKAWLPNASAIGPAASTVEATIAGHGITYGEMTQTVALLKGMWPLVPQIETLLAGYGKDIKNDLIITDQIIELLAQEAASIGVPDAGLVQAGAYGVGFLLRLLPDMQFNPGAYPNYPHHSK